MKEARTAVARNMEDQWLLVLGLNSGSGSSISAIVVKGDDGLRWLVADGLVWVTFFFISFFFFFWWVVGSVIKGEHRW